jgi:hypothetical protein
MPDIRPRDPLSGDILTRRDAARTHEGDRRRSGWSDFRRTYPGFIFTLALGLVAMLAIDGWLIYRRVSYASDVNTLRSHMTGTERERSDAIVATTQNKVRIEVELAKRQASSDKLLHLNVSVDSARMYLTREGAILREMPVEFGPERSVTPAGDSLPATVPRGERTVVEINDDGISLAGGGQIVIAGRDSAAKISTEIPAGALRIPRADFEAMRPNLAAGMKVYFY